MEEHKKEDKKTKKSVLPLLLGILCVAIIIASMLLASQETWRTKDFLQTEGEAMLSNTNSELPFFRSKTRISYEADGNLYKEEIPSVFLWMTQEHGVIMVYYEEGNPVNVRNQALIQTGFMTGAIFLIFLMALFSADRMRQNNAKSDTINDNKPKTVSSKSPNASNCPAEKHRKHKKQSFLEKRMDR